MVRQATAEEEEEKAAGLGVLEQLRATLEDAAAAREAEAGAGPGADRGRLALSSALKV